ncbi:glycolate oxidase iron-sulfur subunit [Gammaproteobacteria bacterium]
MNPPESTPHPPSATLFPVQEADRCVMCGMCLAYCPTYLKNREEGESPRGRIALMTALASGDLPPSPRLHAHLERCLVCRACERVCPSGVPYGRLIDAGRALLLQTDPPSPTSRFIRRVLLEGLIARPRRLRGLGWVLYLLQRTGLAYLAPLFGLGRLARMLPSLLPPRPFRSHYPASGPERGRVALFIGCITGVIDRTTLEAALHVLTHLGYGVDVPPRQGCCGALHLHSGDAAGAQRLIRANLEAFVGTGQEAIVTTASGCGATLAEYPTHQDTIIAGESLPPLPQVVDISTFLARIPWPEEVTLRPLPARVAVHDPCSLANALCQPQGPYTLLRRIPGITVIPLPNNHQCCGGAGAALLTESALTRALGADKIAALREAAPDILVSSNLGCALHLTQGARKAGITVEVMHPVTLLARQLA